MMRVAAVLLCSATVMAGEVHVRPGAPEGGDGSRAAPLASLAEAAPQVGPGDRCILHAGVYRETLKPLRSGTKEAPVTFEAAAGGKAVLSGCDVVEGWVEKSPGLYVAGVEMAPDWKQQVFVDGRMLWLARWPDAPQGALLEFPTATMADGSKRGLIVDRNLPAGDLRGAQVWASSHKRWYSWTAPILGRGADRLRIVDTTDAAGNHVPRKGGKYAILGAEAVFDAPWEWFYDAGAKELRIRLPEGYAGPGKVEVKRRQVAADLRGLEHVRLTGLGVRAATIVTDENSEACRLDRLRVRFPSHSWLARDQYASQRADTGVQLRGRGHSVTHSEIAFSSGNGVVIAAEDCRVVNCWIHDVNYAGTYCSAVSLGFRRNPRGPGRAPASRNLISHCTLARAGRSLVGLSGFHDSLIQFCDLHHAGYLTCDLGLTYGNCISGGGSEFRYNRLHDNVTDSHSMGLYYDHGCKNILSHHNVVRGARHAAMINNQYAMYLLWYHNTAVAEGNGKGYLSAWAAAQPKQLWGCELRANHLRGPIHVRANGGELLRRDNLVVADMPSGGDGLPVPGGQTPEPIPGLVGPVTKATVGALHPEQPWQAGHDFDHPPEVDERRSRVPARNRLVNACFESGNPEPWRLDAGASLHFQPNTRSQWTVDGPGRMGHFSVKLSAEGSRVAQAVASLPQARRWTIIAHVNAPVGCSAHVAVLDGDGRPIARRVVRRKRKPAKGKAWEPVVLDALVPGPTAALAVTHAGGDGPVYVDDLGWAPSRDQHEQPSR